MRRIAIPAVALLLLAGPRRPDAAPMERPITRLSAREARARQREQIRKLDADRRPEATTHLEAFLQSADPDIALRAALALARRGNSQGRAVLEKTLAATPLDARERFGPLLGFDSADHLRYDIISALATLEPEKALQRHITYLEGLRQIQRTLYYRSLADKARPSPIHRAVEGLHRLARKSGRTARVIAHFRTRCDKRPKDSDAYHLLALVLDKDGQREEAHKVRLAEIHNTARCPEEVAVRTLDLRPDLAGYGKLLAFGDEQVARLRQIHKTKLFTSYWGFESVARFHEIVRFRIAGCHGRNCRFDLALAVLTEIFEANPKAECGGSLYSTLHGVRREIDRPRTHEERMACYRKTVRMYADAVKKAPADKELKHLYCRVLLSAAMNDEASRILQTLLQDRQRNVRANAALLLGDFDRRAARRPAADAVPALTRALKDKDSYVREQAAKALESIAEAVEKARKEKADRNRAQP